VEQEGSPTSQRRRDPTIRSLPCRDLSCRVSSSSFQYHGVQFFRESVARLLRQILKDLELVFVDDGSSDGNWEILQTFRTNGPNISSRAEYRRPLCQELPDRKNRLRISGVFECRRSSASHACPGCSSNTSIRTQGFDQPEMTGQESDPCFGALHWRTSFSTLRGVLEH
jgi:hypothetical protein